MVLGQADDWRTFRTSIGLAKMMFVVLLIFASVQAAAADSWPMFMHDVIHSGISDEGVAPPLGLLWKYDIGTTGSSSPAVSGGVVYIGSTDHNVYAINAATGTLKWKYTTGNYVTSSPAVSDGVVYIGSADHNVYALDAATGTPKWKYTTDRDVYSSPAVFGNTVYVGSQDGNLYALDAATSALKWKYMGASSFQYSPAVSNGVVYGVSDGLYALDAATGARKWKYANISNGIESPTISDGAVYIGSLDKNIFVLDAVTGALKWKYTNLSSFPSSLVVHNGVIYISSWYGESGNVSALDAATGTLKWKYEAGNQVSTSPAISDSVIYVGSRDGNIYALDIASGALRWKYTTGSYISSSPAVSGGVVYVGSADGNIYAFAPMLTISANPITVMADNSSDVTFTVTSAGRPVSGAAVILTGAAADNGITDSSGIAIIHVNATDAGAINATASKNGFTSASTTISASVPLSFRIVQVIIDNKKKKIKPESNEDIEVTILTTEGFNALGSINISSVRFGGAPVESGANEGKNVDKDDNLILHFKTHNTNIKCGDNQSTLTGKTYDRMDIIGWASIETIGCGYTPTLTPNVQETTDYSNKTTTKQKSIDIMIVYFYDKVSSVIKYLYFW